MTVAIPKQAVCGIGITVATRSEAIAAICGEPLQGRSVHFANAKTIVDADNNHAYRDALRSAWMVLPDGAPIARLVSKATGTHQQRVAGPDVFEELLSNTTLRHFIIAPNHAVVSYFEREAESNIVGFLVPEFMEHWEFPIETFSKAIEAVQPTHVWVGLGSPKQDFVALKLAQVTCTTVLAVGAALEFSSGQSKRAPELMQRLGFEWLYRLITNPRRLWKRYLFGNTRFLWIVSKQK